MDCLNETRISLFLDGELSRAEVLEIEQHIQACPACREKVCQLEDADLLLQIGLYEREGAPEAGAFEPSSGLVERLVALGSDEEEASPEDEGKIVPFAPSGRRSRRYRRRGGSSRRGFPAGVPIAIAAGLLLMVSLFVLKSMDTTETDRGTRSASGEEPTLVSGDGDRDERGEEEARESGEGPSLVGATDDDAEKTEAVDDEAGTGVEEETGETDNTGDSTTDETRESSEETTGGSESTPGDETSDSEDRETRSRSEETESTTEEETEEVESQPRADFEIALKEVLKPAGGERPVSVRDVRGDLFVRRKGAADYVAYDGSDPVGPGDRLRAGKRGAFLSVETSADLCLREKTELVCSRDGDGLLVRMVRGDMHVDFLAASPDGNLRVRMPGRTLSVVGTRFVCGVASDGTTSCVVRKGTVQLADGRRMSSGQGFVAHFDKEAEIDRESWRRHAGWARGIRPKRAMLKAWDFDRQVSPFKSGTTVATKAHSGRFSLKLEPIEGNKYWGMKAAGTDHQPVFKYWPGMHLRVSIFLERASGFLIQVKNKKQNGLHYAKIYEKGALPHGRWVTIDLPVAELAPYREKDKVLEAGDILSYLSFYSGEPDDPVDTYIDDVRIFIKR